MDAGSTITVASVAIVVLVASAASFLAAAAAAVPAVYVLGDSLADVGNNNHLLTLLKADFPHNGIDYPGRKATGRFSNGKNFPDFLATPKDKEGERSGERRSQAEREGDGKCCVHMRGRTRKRGPCFSNFRKLYK